MTLRWSDYVLARDEEAQDAWAEAAEGRRTLYILGEGFDPRALTGVERLLAAGAARDVTVMSLASRQWRSIRTRAARCRKQEPT